MSVSEFRTRALFGVTAAVSLRRFVNDEILDSATRFDDGATVFAFLCECGDVDCRQHVKLALADYARTAPGSVVGHRRHRYI